FLAEESGPSAHGAAHVPNPQHEKDSIAALSEKQRPRWRFLSSGGFPSSSCPDYMGTSTTRLEPSFPTFASGGFLAVAEDLATPPDEIRDGDQQSAADQRPRTNAQVERPARRRIERRVLNRP